MTRTPFPQAQYPPHHPWHSDNYVRLPARPRRNHTASIVIVSVVGAIAVLCLLTLTFMAVSSRSTAHNVARQQFDECVARAQVSDHPSDIGAICLERYKAAVR